MRVKIISCNSIFDLEDKINDFMETLEKEVTINGKSYKRGVIKDFIFDTGPVTSRVTALIMWEKQYQL